MGMVKGTAKVTNPALEASPSDTALERLSKPTATVKANFVNKPNVVGKAGTPTLYKPRDFDAEARRKVKCVMFEAALQSPAIAGMQFKTMDEFLALVKQAADAGVDYTWK